MSFFDSLIVSFKPFASGAIATCGKGNKVTMGCCWLLLSYCWFIVIVPVSYYSHTCCVLNLNRPACPSGACTFTNPLEVVKVGMKQLLLFIGLLLGFLFLTLPFHSTYGSQTRLQLYGELNHHIQSKLGSKQVYSSSTSLFYYIAQTEGMRGLQKVKNYYSKYHQGHV